MFLAVERFSGAVSVGELLDFLCRRSGLSDV